MFFPNFLKFLSLNFFLVTFGFWFWFNSIFFPFYSLNRGLKTFHHIKLNPSWDANQWHKLQHLKTGKISPVWTLDANNIIFRNVKNFTRKFCEREIWDLQKYSICWNENFKNKLIIQRTCVEVWQGDIFRTLLKLEIGEKAAIISKLCQDIIESFNYFQRKFLKWP
jgi:hypothetical protein